jgi:murein hydrolase activator
MIRVLFSVLIAFAVSLLCAQSLEIQIQRLDYLERMLEAKRSLIAETQEEKTEIEKSIAQYERRLQETKRLINQLVNRENEVKQEITRSQRDSQVTESQIQEISELWQKQLYSLYYHHCLQHNESESILISQYLPPLINQTKAEIDSNQKLLSFIIDNLEINRAEEQRIQREKTEAARTSRSVDGEINRLTHQAQDLSKRERDYLQEYHDLEQSRLALEEMITQIQSDLSRQQFSYQFTNPKLLWPVKGSVVTQFGKAYDEQYKTTTVNNGIDIRLDAPQEVLAVDFGTVVYAETFRSYGKLVIIDHQNGYYSLYGNNGSLLVTKDETISLGQPIAITGSKNDKYQLHFELRRRNVPVDPIPYLE